MRKFTVRLSALPAGTVDFFDLLRRIFNTESITRLVRLRQMLSVSAMLANPQKSSKVPAGSADRRTCKVHSEIESLAPEIFSFLRHVYFCYTFILVVFSFLQYIPLRHCLYLYDNNPSKIKNTAADGVSRITGTIARISKILTALRVCFALSETKGRVCETDTHKRAGKIRNRSVSRDCLRRLRRTSFIFYSINSICTSPRLSSVTIL